MAMVEAPPVGRVYVAGSPVEPARFGLLSIAASQDAPGNRWEAGIEWEGVDSSGGGALPAVCEDNPEPIDFGDSSAGLTRVDPFIVYDVYTCQVVGRDLGEARERARMNLLATEQRQVERVLAGALADAQPNFVDGVVDLGSAGAREAAGILESYLGRTVSGNGALHLPRLLTVDAATFTERQGQHLETLSGTYVALGGGYDLAQEGGPTYAYATGRPRIWRSEVFVSDEEASIDRAINEVTYIAQRVYAVGWSGTAARVEIV